MTNRLAQTQSLYLRKHADNPIDWWSWCDEALEKAKQENKPIFLSIGYSSCHWCTVMEGEAFSDPIVADYLNANYVAIKVDREERPDIDSIYMQALQLMTGQGGWPLNVFLSPHDLLPFYGGTYFPPEAKYGRPSFLQVIQALRNFYDTEAVKLQAVTDELRERLKQGATIEGNGELSEERLQEGLRVSLTVLAAKGGGPKFPMIPHAMTALHSVRFQHNDPDLNRLTVCQQRGMDLALGGIYDHVAGGFHRYTVDPTWTVPHFEKMLYDNGQIIEYLAELWAIGIQEPAFARSIDGTVQWLQREMTAPEGYFYAAQDADSFPRPDDREPEEGAFYVWSYPELEQILTPEELTILEAEFSVNPAGNFEGKNVLQRSRSGELASTAVAALEKLFTVRYGASALDTTTFPPAQNNQQARTLPWKGRIPAVTDTKMIVAWNSLMISGLARSAAVLQNGAYFDLAVRAAQFILNYQWQDHRLHRLNYDGQVSVIAQSEDYALLIKALLDLHQASLSLGQDGQQWLARAQEVQCEFEEFLWSREQGGYYNTDAVSDLVVQERSYGDNATPSANGIAAMNLIRLFLLTEDLQCFDRAEQTLQAFSTVIEQIPQACPSLVSGLDWFRYPTLIRTTPDEIANLAQQYLPTIALRLDSHLPPGVMAMVCKGLSCLEPSTESEQMQRQIQKALGV
ncbi:thioredoxin domain-containing protein [Leptolyngbya sp. FACHB-711]|uniref:thioredoxin domain-containing protein n=1 Tax=unclassified Leptolyngbya TaxID=2650499 RepID=UPI001684D7EB|nr:thioredoxin domain-containing protein [Leptolyngbya sp. FACHB-711]MBD1853674.1 thioredoxin domain-containing protein [Cyanobacteria bacterium FACHB-502]MBD2028075.1 thioredoxin domain-containing protein [Leptolyngbya sp. FACHB-711]